MRNTGSSKDQCHIPRMDDGFTDGKSRIPFFHQGQLELVMTMQGIIRMPEEGKVEAFLRRQISTVL